MKAAFAPIPRELVSSVEFYDYKAPLSKALASINRLGAVVVTRNGDYYGVADDRTVSHRNIIRLSPGYPIGKVAKIAPMLDKESTVENAIVDFYHSSVKALPYIEGTKVSGIVKRMDILKAILSLNLLASEKVKSAMTSPILAVDYDATVDQALNIMRQNKVNRLILLEDKKLFGILTYKNLMRYALQARGRAPKYSGTKSLTLDRISDISERNVYTVDDGQRINDAIRLFVKNNISSLLVVRNGRPAGMITVRDVLELFAKSAKERKSRILISGLDDYTREYEEDIINELDALAERIDRFHRMEVDYIALNIKRVKTRNYELSARVGLSKSGAIAFHSRGFLLDNTLKELTSKLYNAVKNRKEIIVTGKKV